VLINGWQTRRAAEALNSEIAALNSDGRPLLADAIGPIQPGLLRGNERSRGYLIAPGADIVQLRFSVPQDSVESYRVRKETDGGETIFELPHVSPVYADGEKQVLLDLPSRIIEPGNHYFRLSGNSASGEVREIGVYYLKIVR
jgi:hypothetical protein